SGWLDAATTLGPVTLGGSLIGGTVLDIVTSMSGGAIMSGGAMGLVKIAGNLIAGVQQAGNIHSGGVLAGITLGGSLDGDSSHQGLIVSGQLSAQIFSEGAMGPVKIGRDLIGGSSNDSGGIFSKSTIASLTIGGSMRGGQVDCTGALGPVKIGADLI